MFHSPLDYVAALVIAVLLGYCIRKLIKLAR